MALATEVAEALANFIMMAVTKVMRLKTALYVFCALILAGTSVLFIYTSVQNEGVKENDVVYPIFLLFINLGIVAEFDIVYLINAEYFQPAILATAYGICNVAARSISILAPLVGRISNPWPLAILIVYSGLTILFAT